MAVDQLPGHVREFANYLNGLLARLNQDGGWCAVFWQRDPDGMRACLEGREVPPWDVVEALLQDLAVEFGPGAVNREAERARALHAAALFAYDTRPGGREALGDRFDVMLREQRYAAERQAELGRLLASATTRQEADTIRLDLAWARDDHERATARCAELRSRMAHVDRRVPGGRVEAIRRGRLSESAAYHVEGDFTDRAVPSGDDWQGRPGGRDAGFLQQHGSYDPAGTGAGGQRAPYADEGEAGRSHDAHDRDPEAGMRRDLRERGVGGLWRSAYDAESWTAQQGRAEAAAPGAPQRPAPRPSPVTSSTSSTSSTSEFFEPAQSAPAQAAPESPVPQAPVPTTASSGPTETTPEAPTPKQRKRRRGSARFAGMVEDDAAPVVVPPASEPALPAPAAPAGRTPRGARFAGGAEAPVRSAEPQAEPLDSAGAREVAEGVERLVRLRMEGRTGEAHALLVEAAHWPAARFPLLAGELQRAGLGADWATLLWEAASLPPEQLVAAADALVAAGRGPDGEQILRQGVARPAAEIGEAVLGLVGERRGREVGALLDAYVRVRTPEEAARSVEPDPDTLVPLLLQAARGVSDERHWDLVHALRVAGFAA
ncbi:hypothetical protein ACWC09_14980 [Streptomyces sp. NPDC001617]